MWDSSHTHTHHTINQNWAYIHTTLNFDTTYCADNNIGEIPIERLI